jgi:hypothetical protein
MMGDTMLRKLGWQQIGVVLSVLWVPLSLVYTFRQYADQKWNSAMVDREICVIDKRRDRSLDCYKAVSQSLDQYPSLDWVDVLLRTLAPLLLAWLVAWIIFATARWVHAGFDSQA